MRVVIEIQDDAELRRVTSLLREEGIEIRVGGDGASAPIAFDAAQRYDELTKRFGSFRGTLPPNYSFDRDELHDRHG